MWRVNGRRVSSVEEIDEAIRRTPTGERVRLSVVSRGEHVEWPARSSRKSRRRRASPSGLAGGGPTRQLPRLGLDAPLRDVRRGACRWSRSSRSASRSPALRCGDGAARARAGSPLRRPSRCSRVGVALTAMRTTLVGLRRRRAGGRVARDARGGARARARRGGGRVRPRARRVRRVAHARGRRAPPGRRERGSARLQVARVAALARRRCTRSSATAWTRCTSTGASGASPARTCSTRTRRPIQLAFDRGLPALLFWLWLMSVFWLVAARAERSGATRTRRRARPRARRHRRARGLPRQLARQLQLRRRRSRAARLVDDGRGGGTGER